MIYLDNAATTFPKPKAMLQAMRSCIESYCGNPGRSGHKMSMKTAEEIFKARNQIGRLLNIENKERIIFTSNATESLNLAIKGVLYKGDHVITTAMEHNSVLRPLKAMEYGGIELTIVPGRRDGTLDAADIQRAVRDNTRLIVCTLASNVTGAIMPVGEIIQIARQNRILFLLDASQGAGVLPIDAHLWNVDMLAAPGHKGLLGPQGTGFLYVREGVALQHFKQGGTGTYSLMLEQPGDFPDGYEAGTVNAPGIIGLGASAAYINRLGTESIRAHEDQLTRQLDNALRDMKHITIYGPENCARRTGIVAFNVKHKGCEEVADELNNRFDIAVRAGFHCAPFAHQSIGTGESGSVRASVGLFTTKEEIARTIQAIHKIQKTS